jgi:hypothetical protein
MKSGYQLHVRYQHGHKRTSFIEAVRVGNFNENQYGPNTRFITSPRTEQFASGIIRWAEKSEQNIKRPRRLHSILPFETLDRYQRVSKPDRVNSIPQTHENRERAQDGQRHLGKCQQVWKFPAPTGTSTSTPNIFPLINGYTWIQIERVAALKASPLTTQGAVSVVLIYEYPNRTAHDKDEIIVIDHSRIYDLMTYVPHKRDQVNRVTSSRYRGHR